MKPLVLKGSSFFPTGPVLIIFNFGVPRLDRSLYESTVPSFTFLTLENTIVISYSGTSPVTLGFNRLFDTALNHLGRKPQ